MSKPRKVRRDSKLKNLPPETARQIAGWLAEDGAPSCLQRMRAELGISSNQTSLYEAIAFWEVREEYTAFEKLAIGQAENEAHSRGGMTADEMQEAVDRNFIMLAAKSKDTDLYKELRYLRIADQSAKSQGRIAELKLKQAEVKLTQKDRDWQLAEKKFQRETCSLFLEWFSKETAKQIATSGATNAEKIEQLGLAMFGEDWKQ